MFCWRWFSMQNSLFAKHFLFLDLYYWETINIIFHSCFLKVLDNFTYGGLKSIKVEISDRLLYWCSKMGSLKILMSPAYGKLADRRAEAENWGGEEQACWASGRLFLSVIPPVRRKFQINGIKPQNCVFVPLNQFLHYLSPFQIYSINLMHSMAASSLQNVGFFFLSLAQGYSGCWR